MGYAVGPSRPLMAALVLPALSLQVVLFHGLRFSLLQPVLQNPVPEQMALGMSGGGSFARIVVTYGFLLLTFAATALTCVPLGQLAARSPPSPWPSLYSPSARWFLCTPGRPNRPSDGVS